MSGPDGTSTGWLTLKRRRIIAWTALGLALLLLLVGSLTVWVKRQALDTDNWVAASSQLLEDDEVRALVAEELVDALFSGPDVEARIQDRLPPQLEGLAGPATGLLREAAVPAADRFLARPGTQQLWEQANRLAHERLIALLDGDDDGRLLTSSDGDVVLDLRPLITRLGNRIGVQPALEGDRGVITILQSDELAAAQDAVQAIRTLSALIVIGVIALVVLAVWIGEGIRRRLLVALSLGAIGIGVVLLIVRRLAGDAVVDALTEPVNRDAGTAVWLIGTELLRDLAAALIVYGLVLLVGAWLAGPARLAVAARRRLAPAVRDHMIWVWGVVAAIFLALLAWGPTSGDRRLLGVVALAALVAAGVEILRRQIVRENAAQGGAT
jgi:hypothetical protein